MPGPVSDSFDPEWGTSHNAALIQDNLQTVYQVVSRVLNHRQPMYVLDLVEAELPEEITATLTDKQWRIIRFALERAGDSI